MRAADRTRAWRVAKLVGAVCPACGCEEVWRVHRRTAADWLLSPLGLRPYRCAACRRRFYAWPALRELAMSPREARALALRQGEWGR